MLKPKEFLYLYRILNWENKLSGLRPIGYTIFGYLITGRFDLLPIVANTIAIFGALSLTIALNDFFDFKIQKENNFLGNLITSKRLSEKQAFLLCLLPGIMIFPLILINSALALTLFSVGLLLNIFYSLPPIRIKQWGILGVLIAPIGVVILYLQSYSVLLTPSATILMLAVVIFLFQLYLELLHIVDDSFVNEEIKTTAAINSQINLIKILPLVSVVVSLFFVILKPIFLVSTVFSLIRFAAVRKLDIAEISKFRRNFLSLKLSLYEFVIYGALGVLHRFN